MTEITAADGLCNGLYLSITGAVDMAAWEELGWDTAAFDGYQVGYAMILEDPLAASDVQLSCFGAAADEAGYFCTGVFGSETEGDYSIHGAAYWQLSEEELAAKAAMEEAAATEGETAEEEDVEDAYAEVEAEYEEYEYYDPEAALAEFADWATRGLPMDDAVMAVYDPASWCEPVFDEYYGEYGTECAVPETATFTGSWFQPKEADSYSGNFRMSGGMEGWAMCADGATKSDYTSFTFEGAAHLTAGAAILAVASLI
jgi:hypothetical protein